MNQLTLNSSITMSSLELVEIINSLRDKGKPELRHDNFMVKIENHPGITSPKFLGYVEISIGNGATRKSKCYYLPKREAELMVMSESLQVQTRVYDRMTELEEALRIAPPTQQRARRAAIPSGMRDQVSALLMIGKAMSKVKGVNDALAMACTLDSIERTTGLPAMLMTKALPAVAPEETATLNASQIGEPLGLNGRTANALLEKLGLQYRDEGKNWRLTEAGTAFGEMKPFHRNGHSGYEVRWKATAVEVVRKHLDGMEKTA
jgi:hypothetical protein